MSPAMAQKQRLIVRYYLWADDGPWRLPNRLHQDLIDRKVALPQYAGTKQKIAEVFARRVGGDTFSLRGQGNIFTFDKDGYLDLSAYIEATSMVVEGTEPKRIGENIFDVKPALKHQRFARENLWKPTPSMLRLLVTDFQPASPKIGAHKVRIMKRPR
jgi:hypothetical protein